MPFRDNIIVMFLSLCCSQVLSAPNVLRVGTTENIFVECQECKTDMAVNIRVMNFPTKTSTLAQTSVNLNSRNKYQAFGKLMVNNLSGQTYNTVDVLCDSFLIFYFFKLVSVTNFSMWISSPCLCGFS